MRRVNLNDTRWCTLLHGQTGFEDRSLQVGSQACLAVEPLNEKILSQTDRLIRAKCQACHALEALKRLSSTESLRRAFVMIDRRHNAFLSTSLSHSLPPGWDSIQCIQARHSMTSWSLVLRTPKILFLVINDKNCKRALHRSSGQKIAEVHQNILPCVIG